MSSLPDWVKPGASYTIHGRKYHVRGIVDGQAVVREWWPSKQRWNYAVISAIDFEVWKEMDSISHKRFAPRLNSERRYPVAEGEELRPGDAVGFNDRGELQKAIPGMKHTGTLPPGSVVKGNVVQVPEIDPSNGQPLEPVERNPL